MFKLSDMAKSTIQNTVMNYLSTISSDEDIDISFENVDDGTTNAITLKCTKKSKTPTMYKQVKLKDGSVKVDTGSNSGDANQNVDNSKISS